MKHAQVPDIAGRISDYDSIFPTRVAQMIKKDSTRDGGSAAGVASPPAHARPWDGAAYLVLLTSRCLDARGLAATRSRSWYTEISRQWRPCAPSEACAAYASRTARNFLQSSSYVCCPGRNLDEPSADLCYNLYAVEVSGTRSDEKLAARATRPGTDQPSLTAAAARKISRIPLSSRNGLRYTAQ